MFHVYNVKHLKTVVFNSLSVLDSLRFNCSASRQKRRILNAELNFTHINVQKIILSTQRGLGFGKKKNTLLACIKKIKKKNMIR